MKVLAVIVNYRTPERTIEAVGSLLEALDLASARIAIVENNSGDGSHDRIARGLAERGWQQHVDLIRSPRNGGFGYGNNLAIRRAQEHGPSPDYFYFMNPDAIAEPDAVRALLAF